MDISNIAEKLTTIAENQQRVYDAGVDSGIEVGKQAEYDAFWDAYQYKGARVNYAQGFGGIGWTNNTFKPKYNIQPTSCNGMFQTSQITDLKQSVEKAGVIFDLSKSDNVDYLFNGCTQMVRVPVIDISGSRANRYLFNVCRLLVEVEKLILKYDGSQVLTGSFGQCNALTTICVEGVIGDSLDFSACPLTRDSMLGKEITDEYYNALTANQQQYNTIVFNNKRYYGGIVAALSASPTLTGKTTKFKKTAKEAAFTAEEWDVLIALRSNWTFNLA